MGGRMDLNEGAQTMSMDGTCPRAPLPGLSDDERRHVYYYSVFPNFMIAPHPDYVLTHTLWPLAPNRTRIVCDWLVHPAEAAKPGFDLSDATAFWDMTNRQDWHVCELAQAGISSRGYQPGPYSNREDLLYAFDRYIVSELGPALASAAFAGCPLGDLVANHRELHLGFCQIESRFRAHARSPASLPPASPGPSGPGIRRGLCHASPVRAVRVHLLRPHRLDFTHAQIGQRRIVLIATNACRAAIFCCVALSADSSARISPRSASTSPAAQGRC